MNGRSGILLLLAVVCGLGAMYGVRKVLTREQKPGQTREILAAACDLKVEEVLKPDMVKVIHVPEDNVPAGSFSSYKDVADRWVRVPMLTDDVIVEAKIAPKDAPVGLLSRIPENMRAFSIDVSEQTGVSGFVLPDHRVDVVLTRNNNGIRSGQQSETILQDVQVLAAGTVTSRPEDKSIQVRTVTLAVTPQQVERLNSAHAEGSLSLSLRGLNDHKTIEASPEPGKGESRTILVAAVELRPGTTVTARQIKTRSMKSEDDVHDVFTEPHQLVGRKVQTQIAADEPILAVKLAPLGSAEATDPEPELVLRTDMRAIPIRVEDLVGGIGPIHRGDVADVVYRRVEKDGDTAPVRLGVVAAASESKTADPATGSPASPAPHAQEGSVPGESQRVLPPATEIILQNIRVLSTPWDESGTSARGATTHSQDVMILEIPAVEVTRLIQKLSTGKLTLVARGPGDEGIIDGSRIVPPQLGWIHHGPRSSESFFITEGREEPARVVRRPNRAVQRTAAVSLFHRDVRDP